MVDVYKPLWLFCLHYTNSSRVVVLALSVNPSIPNRERVYMSVHKHASVHLGTDYF